MEDFIYKEQNGKVSVEVTKSHVAINGMICSVRNISNIGCVIESRPWKFLVYGIALVLFSALIYNFSLLLAILAGFFGVVTILIYSLVLKKKYWMVMRDSSGTTDIFWSHDAAFVWRVIEGLKKAITQSA